jgi:hypothetical protein
MVLIKEITDDHVTFAPNGRIVVRNHPLGHRSVMVIRRESCPWCVKAKAAYEDLASKDAGPAVVYVVDMENPRCQTLVNTFKPNGVPSWYRVNPVGRLDREEYNLDWQEPAAFLRAIERKS